MDAPHSFVPPPGIGDSRPRDVRLTAAGWVLALTATALLVFAAVISSVLVSLSMRQAAIGRELASRGVGASAQVVQLWRSSGDSHQPWVSYWWTTGGRDYQAQAKVRLRTWQSLSVGAPIAIRYVPDDPAISSLAGVEPSALPLWLGPLISIALLGLAAGCVLWLNAERRLLAEGRAARALVVAHRKTQTSHGGTYRSIVYRFALLSGAEVTGKSQSPRKTPAIGSRITVLYDPDRPMRNQPYPLHLVRVARA